MDVWVAGWSTEVGEFECVCVCVCVCVCGGGGAILKREARMGPWPRAVARGAETSGAILSACAPVLGDCSSRGRGPSLSHNLSGWGFMSPLSLLCHAVPCSARQRSTHPLGLGGGGGRGHPDSLVGTHPCELQWACWLVPASFCRRFAGCALPIDVPHHADLARPLTAGIARRDL